MIALKDHIAEKLAGLPERDLYQVWDFLQYLEWREVHSDRVRPLTAPTTTQPDALVGLFAGPPDLAECSEAILQQAAETQAG